MKSALGAQRVCRGSERLRQRTVGATVLKSQSADVTGIGAVSDEAKTLKLGGQVRK